MTGQANIEPRLNPLKAEQVADFLREHLEFFDEYPQLVAELRLSHASGNAVSLVERQIQVLRDQNQDLKSKLLELVNVARDNDRLSERMHRMTLDLLAASSLCELLDSLRDHLHTEFNADAIAIHLPNLTEIQQRETGAKNLELDAALSELFRTSLIDGKPQCGRLKRAQLDFLFGDPAAAIESASVIPLGERGHSGLLAIGSQEVNRFNPCMGTLFLSYLGELLSCLLRNHANS